MAAPIKKSFLLACFAFAIYAFSSVWFIQTARSQENTSWSRGTFVHPSEGISTEEKLSLWLVTQDSRLVGRFVYFQPAEGNSRTGRISGVKATDGTFWPDVTLQVRTEKTATWQTITSARIDGIAAIVTIDKNQRDFGLHVLFDPFKPFIGKFKLGRVILKTGETATFSLENLEEPKESNRDPS